MQITTERNNLMQCTVLAYLIHDPLREINDNKNTSEKRKPNIFSKCKRTNTKEMKSLQLVKTFNNYFPNVTESLKLKSHPNFNSQSLSGITKTVIV